MSWFFINGSPLRRGGQSWSSYWLARSLFFLDGTIIDSGGNKYFQDKSSNGRNFLITSYDFDSSWASGFPYKSAATISAPAGDAALIAADINNFLYDSGGTPNAIPVVSLFQDIDYEHKIFCKHVAQAVDGNDVETSEPYVSHIFMSKTVLSGDDLTKAQTEFEVPTENVSATWIDFINGNDTTGNGTKTTPYKTIAKVLTLSLSNGSEIYIKTGLSPLGTQQTVGKAWKFKGLGYTRITSSGYALFVTSTAETEFHRLVLTDNASNIYVYNNVNTKVENCRIITPGAAFLIAETASVAAKYCVISGGTSTFRINETANVHTIVFDTCYQQNVTNLQVNYITGNLQANTFTFKNSSINNGIIISSGTWTILGNKFSRRAIYTDSTYDHSATVNIKYNRFIHAVASQNIILLGTNGTNKNKFTVTIDGNYFQDAFSDTYNIILNEQASVDVKNNIIYHTGTASTKYAISITGTVADTSSCKVKNNFILSNSYMSLIGIGEDAAACTNRISGIEIENNYCECSTINGNHGVGVFRQSNFIIRYNKIIKAGIALITKALESESSGGIVSYNLCYDCTANLLAKGSNAVLFYNNTVYVLTKLGYAFNLMPSEYVGSVFATACEFKNNIVYDLAPHSGEADLDYILSVPTGADETDVLTNSNVLDDNNIYTINNKYSRFADTLTDAIADGIELNSISTNPNLDTELIPASSLSGSDLGAAYDDGLDITTTWGSLSQVPVIITKQQSATWQIGAYLK